MAFKGNRGTCEEHIGKSRLKNPYVSNEYEQAIA